MATLISYIFLVMLVGYDVWSIRKIHRATLWAGGFLVIAYSLRFPIGQSTAWHTFAGWVQHAAR